MKASHISSMSVALALRNATSQLQSRLPELQTEMVTGKHYDSGLVLGSQSRKLVSFKNDIDQLSRLMDTNAQASTRMSMTQDSMTRLNDLASEVQNAVGIAMGHAGSNFSAQLTATNAVAELTSILNTQANGAFIFGGLNASNQPIQDYETGPAKAAFDAAFSGYFGFAKDDAAAANITATQMDDFLTNVVEPMFMGADWYTNFSTATDEVVTSRVSSGVTLDTSVSANEKSFRQLMLASVTASELYDSNISNAGLQQVTEYVILQAGSSAGNLTELQGRAGLVEERLTRANDALSSQKTLLEQFASEMESVDPYETSIELNSLLTQIETSYSITSRIQQLSIMRFL